MPYRMVDELLTETLDAAMFLMHLTRRRRGGRKLTIVDDESGAAAASPPLISTSPCRCLPTDR
jgi:hypothetical protein